MVEFLLFGSLFWTIFTYSLLFITAFLCEASRNGYLSFIAAMVVLSLYIFTTGLPQIGYTYIAGYFGIGLIYAFIRSYLTGKKMGKKYRDIVYGNPKGDDHATLLRRVEDGKYDLIRLLQKNVMRWWLQWPISLIYWFCKDMIRNIWENVKEVFIKIATFGYDRS